MPPAAGEPRELRAEGTAPPVSVAAGSRSRPVPAGGHPGPSSQAGQPASTPPHRRSALPWAGLAFVGWLTLTLAIYYGLHKPPLTALIPTWPIDLVVSPSVRLETLGEVGWAIWIGLAAVSAGWWLLGRIWPEELDRPARQDGPARPDGPTGPDYREGAPRRPAGLVAIATSFGLGVGAIGLVMLLLGLAGGYHAPWLAAVLLGLTLLGLAGRPWRAIPTRYPQQLVARLRHIVVGTGFKPAPTDASAAMTTAVDSPRLAGATVLPRRIWAGFLAVTLGLAGLSALGPPIEWDALTYHLAAPRVFLEAGRLLPLPGPHFAFPALLDLVFALGLGLGGEVSARLIGWGCALALAAALAGVTGYWFKRTDRWSAPALFFSAPSITLLAGWAYVDLALALFTLLTGHFAAVYRRTGARPALVLTGLLAGFALGLKYTAGAVVVAAAGIVLLRAGWRWWQALTSVAALLALAALVATPWYLKNWLWYGNPIYPVLFGGREWDAWRTALFARPGSGFWAEPWRLLVAPIEMTLLGAEGAWGYQASLGPLWLALVPALAHLRRDPAARLLGCFAAGLYGLWLVGLAYSQVFQQSRLLFPALAVLAVLLAAGIGRLAVWDRPGLRASWVVGRGVLIALMLGALAQLAAFRGLNPVGIVVGAETRDRYLERVLGSYYQVAQIAGSLPGADRDLLPLYEPRGYYLERAIRPDVALDNWGWAVERYGGADAIAAAFRASGVRYVLLNKAGLAFLTEEPYRDVSPRELAVLLEFQQDQAIVIHGAPLVLLGPADDPRVDRRGDSYVLYRLRDPS